MIELAQPHRPPALRFLRPGEFDPAPFAALVSDAFRIHRSMNGEDRTSAEGLLDELGEDGVLLALVEGERPLACALVRPASSIGRRFEIEWLKRHPNALYYALASVDPAFMGRGLGRRLLEATEEFAKAKGHDSVVLSALREWGNDKYYAAHGYITDDILEYTNKLGELQHLHRMVKVLRPST